jgi:hypothetical protein
MMAAYQGTYWEQTFALTDEEGDAIDLSGFTFEADVRSSVTSDETLFTLTSGDGIDIVDAGAGRLKVSMTAARTDLCPIGRVVFDVHHLNADPGPAFLFRATLKVKQSVTR